MVDVVVIGAGFSGLSAAKDLAAANLRVVVVEARDRMGGRAWSYRLGDGTSVDLGAAWIHGHSSNNPVSQLTKRLNIQSKTSDWEMLDIRCLNGTRLGKKEVDDAFQLADDLIGRAKQQRGELRVRRKHDPNADRSIAEAIQTVLQDERKKLKGGKQSGSGKSRFESDIVHWALYMSLVEDYGASLDRLSLLYWDADSEFSGPDSLLPGNYQCVAEALAQGMDVRLSTQALSVQHSSDSVTVNLCQTLNQPDSKAVVSALSARACVVTVPLGCLKAGSVSFSPELTAPKATAINRIGFGLYNKVVIRFQEADVFWDRKTLGFGLVSLSNLKGSSESVTSGQIDPVSEIWFPFFMNLIPSTGSFTLVGACHRPEMEMLCDTEITELAMRALAAFFSNSRLPSPVEVKVTRWNSDRFSQGSYSSLPAGAEPDLYRTLARPEGALFFAGEHTIAMYPQSIHGAILSGQDAARAVSKYLNRQIHVRPQANGSISGQSAVNSVSTASAQPSIDLVIPTTGPFTTTLAEVELAHDRSLSSLQLADELQLELSEWQNPPDDAFFEW